MKQLLAFLVLLAIGAAAMMWFVGDERAVRTTRPDDVPGQQQPVGPPGVGVGQGGVGATVTQSGRLDLTRWREVPLGDGRIRREEVYVLAAEQSQPIGEGLQQLDGVTLKVFDEGAHVATVRADRAFVELGRDAAGRSTLDEQKEVDLRGTVVTGEPGGKLAGLSLELGDARVEIGDEELRLTTGLAQAVRIEMAGDRPVTLTGTGAKARLPRSRGAGPRRADVEILRDPVLTTDDVTVRARGRLRYVEDTVAGTALVTLDEDVELELRRSDLAVPGLARPPATDGNARRSTVRGDQFTGWLVRDGGGERGPEHRAMTWHRLTLFGAPAVVEAPGLRIRTPRLTVLPGPLGDPYVVTAHGGESRIEQTELGQKQIEEDTVSGTSPRRMHLIRPGDGAGSLHRAFGFPRWTLRSLDQQQVFVLEEGARLESGARTLSASDGLVVVRRLADETGVVQGFGSIEVRQRGERPGQPDLVARGSDGALLAVGDGWERLRVGPLQDDSSGRWREHRFEVDRGTARLRGLGTCRLERRGERSEVELLAPYDEIRAEFPDDAVELRSVRQLHALLDGEQLAELDVGGLPTRARIDRGDEVVVAEAPRILQIGPRSLRLLPMPEGVAPWSELSELDRTPHLVRTWRRPDTPADAPDFRVEVFGPSIDVHHAGGREVVVDAVASGDDAPRVYVRLPQAAAVEATTVTCSADRIRVLPFALFPETRRALFAGVHGPVADLVFHSLGKPWLLVDEVREFALDDAQQGHVTGTAARLHVSQGGAAALFVGDPDRQVPAVVERTLGGRTIRLEGARVRAHRDEVVRLAAFGSFEDRDVFLMPQMTLHEPGRTGLLSHMRAACRGNILVDPDAVRFGGPVVARSLRADGSEDPEGLFLEAEQLQMRRAGGEIVQAVGKNVHVDWTRLDARAAEVELDLRESRCTARDPAGARVDLPDGRSFESPRIEVNYRTWSVSMGRGKAWQRSTGPEGER